MTASNLVYIIMIRPGPPAIFSRTTSMVETTPTSDYRWCPQWKQERPVNKTNSCPGSHHQAFIYEGLFVYPYSPFSFPSRLLDVFKYSFQSNIEYKISGSHTSKH